MNNELIIDVVTYQDMREAMQGSVQEHWNEVPFGDYNLELEMHDAIYENAERDGHARFYVAYIGRNAVAYMFIFAAEMSHHKGIMQAVTDAYYVVPKYRKDGIFGKLLTYVEKDIKSLGIRFLTIGHNPMYKGKTPELLLERGYSCTEVAYTIEV
jgi:GNAT superfamily N-acetyltransferase